MYQYPWEPGHQQPQHTRSMPHLYTWPALTACVFLYLAAWVLVGVSGGETGNTGTQNASLSASLTSIGVLSLLVLHAIIMCVDRQNFFTFNGKIVWRSLGGWSRIGLVLAYGACWIMPPLYLCVSIKYRWEVQRGAPSFNAQSNAQRDVGQPAQDHMLGASLVPPRSNPPEALAAQEEDTRPLLPGVLPCTRVFISYCQKDKEHAQRLKTHFAYYEQKGTVEIWDDTKIAPGALWQEEMKKAIARTRVVLLLVSADYLASQFITENELPPLLHAASTEGATIIPVIVSACAFADSELACFQTVNSPEKPLSGLRWDERENIWATVARMVSSATGQHRPLARSNAQPPLIERKKGFERETARAQQLVFERPAGWEYLLTAELLYSRLVPIRKQLSEIAQGLVYQESRPMRGDIFFQWAQQQYAVCSSLVACAATVLHRDIPASWGAPGTVGDPVAVKRAVEKVVGTCHDMLKQKTQIHSVLVPKQLAPLQRIMESWSVVFIDEIGGMPAQLAAPFAQPPAPGSAFPLRLTVGEPEGLSAFRREVQRIQARVKRHGQSILFS